MRPVILNPLFTPLTTLSGVGARLGALYHKLLGPVERDALVLDLVFHLPASMVDRRLRSTLADAEPDVLTTFKLRILSHRPAPPGRRSMPHKVICEDETGDIELVFFKSPAARVLSSLPIGEIRYISGSFTLYDGHRQMVHPDRIMDEEAFARAPLIEPVYPQTYGLTSRMIARTVQAALARLPDLPEWNDPSLMAKEQYPSFSDSVRQLHTPQRPEDVTGITPARMRLAYDELLASQLALLMVRAQMKKAAGIARIGSGALEARLLAALPYQLTHDQQTAVKEIKADLETSERMLRLLQGDVGAGKTVVAMLAMAHVIEAGFQAALMAPTEILARQHFETLKPLADSIGIKVQLLTGRDKGAARKALLSDLAAGHIDVLIGTHALFQDDVAFARLGLAIIDEQHRFGVHQRLALSRKGEAVDVLVMTATPIPRTLVLTYFGDMDVSVLRQKPPGRQKIDTRAISLDRLDEVTEAVARALATQRQVYWICPLVSENDELDLTAVEERFADLASRFGTQVGLLHGQLKSAMKDEAMQLFASGQTRLLVATSVIEVGVDVPNASVMVIEHAERFGLSQLHQLRGRIGRGSAQSTCLLLHKRGAGETAQARIDIMRQSEDGFLIAEEDLKLRGEGDVLGTRQSGMPGFKFAMPEKHGDLLATARDDAKLTLLKDPKLESPRGQALRHLLYLFERDAAIKLLRAG